MMVFRTRSLLSEVDPPESVKKETKNHGKEALGSRNWKDVNLYKTRNKMKTWSFILSAFPLLAFAQVTDYQKLIDSLVFVTDMPYACELVLDGNVPHHRDSMIYNVGCGDKHFWQVVKGKQQMIPLLLDKLDDTTRTAAPVPYFGGQYTLADIAYTALQEIIKDIPTFELLRIKFKSRGCGFCAYWNHLRKTPKNRRKFKAAVADWYQQNKANLVWVSSDEFLTCDCIGFNHPNKGHFELRE
jgi:hypothetical protein